MQFNGTPPLAEATDEELVEAFRAGERGAFGELYARYATNVTGWFGNRRPSASQVELEDLTQDVFTLALELADEFEIDPDSGRTCFRQWLFGFLCKRVLVTAGRSGWADNERFTRSVESYAETLRLGPVEVPQVATVQELSPELRAKVEALRPHYRQAIELHYLEGQTTPTVALIMGRTPGSATWTVAAAVDELRNPKDVKADRHATVTRILDAACRLYAERGEALTMRDVVVAGNLTGTSHVAHYFGTLERLVSLVASGEAAAILEGRAPVPATEVLRQGYAPKPRKSSAEIVTALLKAAVHHYQRDGFAVSGRSVAETAGVSAGNINKFFGSRAGLIALIESGEAAEILAGHRPLPIPQAGASRTAHTKQPVPALADAA